jgi:hypothetical protein
LTPVLNFDSAEHYPEFDNSGMLDSVLISKVERLTKDGKDIGPGAYNVHESKKVVEKSPRGTIKWSNSKTQREEHFIKT